MLSKFPLKDDCKKKYITRIDLINPNRFVCLYTKKGRQHSGDLF